MVDFLIEVNSRGEVQYDFAFHLVKAIEFHRWVNNTQNIYNYQYVSISDLPKHEFKTYLVPVGSVEFVSKYYPNFNLRPLNIPAELRDYKFTKRKIWDTVPEVRPLFEKSASLIKADTYRVEAGENANYSDGFYSEFIKDIDAEFRCFVNRGMLLDVRRYSGCMDILPDFDLIDEIIDTYKSGRSDSYTLDVGVNDEGTFIIELHDFFSCGLYGFASYHHLVPMFINTHFKILRKLGINYN